MTSERIALGGGNEIALTGKTGKDGMWGLIWYHQRPENGKPCSGCLSWDPADSKHWALVSLSPLTLSPSLKCDACGRHGWIGNGRWKPA